MFTPITQLLQRNTKRKGLFLILCFSLLSLYPIYKNFYNGRAVTTYERHIALIEGRSEYYNPWQYRMLSPMIIEGLMWTYNHTVDKIYPIEEKLHIKINETSEPTPETKEFIQLLNTKGALKYMIVFIFFRFMLNLLVFALAYCLWRYFVESNWLIFFGLCFVTLAMGNAVAASDLTFNTYLDNIFYLLTAYLIVHKKNPVWLFVIVPLAAFNRETSLLIPFLYFISQMDFSGFQLKKAFSTLRFPPLKIWMITGALYIIFFSIFIAVRVHYGYRPPQIWKVPAGIQMIKLNLFSAVAMKSYFEMLGVFTVIPLIILYKFRSFPLLLKVWFLGIVPAWFAVHLYSVVTYQTRLFLVPVIMVMMPMLLWLIENEIKKKTRTV